MSDRFDPDAWPLPEDDDPAKKPGGSHMASNQDDYKSLDFDNPSGSQNRGDYGDPYSDAPYSDSGYREGDFGFGNDQGTQGGYGSNDGYDNDLGRQTDSSDWTAAGAVNRNDGYDDGSNGDRYGSESSNGFDNDGYRNEDGYNDGRNDGYDDSYNDGYRNGDGYDDDYDDGYDDDYDQRDDNRGGGLLRKLLPALIALLLLVALIAGILAFLGKNKGDAPVDPDSSQETTVLTDPTQTTVTTALDAQTAQLPADVKAGIDAALAGWGKFAVNGNLDEVRPFFVTTGSQFQRFESESRSLRDNPPGGTPLIMKTSNEQAQRAGSDWIVTSDVLVSRAGEQDQQFKWEMRVSKVNDAWQISSIRQIS